MKMLLDFIPIVIFFVVYKVQDIYWATGVAIVVSAVIVAYAWLKHRKVERMQLVSLALIAVLGGLTLLFHNERFIKWKPTAVYWAFAIAFMGSHVIGNRQPLVKRMLGTQLELPESIWGKLNYAWIAFFIVAGIANLAVAFTCETNTWVNFKLFGLLGMFVLFAIGQAFFLSKYLPEEPAKPNPDEP